MDFLDDIFGPETDEDRLAERNLVHEEEWLNRLVELRKAKNLSQGDVGERMGISQSGVARIEAGNRDLHLSSLRRYAIAVGAQPRNQTCAAGLEYINLDDPTNPFKPGCASSDGYTHDAQCGEFS